jgi:hypothetical protein
MSLANEARKKISNRVGNNLMGLGAQPQIVGANLDDVADQLIAQQERTYVD